MLSTYNRENNQRKKINKREEFEAYVAAVRDGEDVSASIEDFSDFDLSEADCKNFNFKKVNVKGASLINAEFAGADIAGADFTKTDLSNVDFRTVRSYDHETNLTKANLRNANVDAALIRTAKVPEAALIRIDMQGYDLQDLNLRGVMFNLSNLSGAKFCRSNLSLASFNDAILEATDFSYTDISTARLYTTHVDENTKFVGAIILRNPILSPEVRRIAKAQGAIFSLQDFVKAVKHDRFDTADGMPLDYFKFLCAELIFDKLKVPAKDLENPSINTLWSLYHEIKELEDGSIACVISEIQKWKSKLTDDGELNLEIVRKKRETKKFIEDLLSALLMYAKKHRQKSDDEIDVNAVDYNYLEIDQRLAQIKGSIGIYQLQLVDDRGAQFRGALDTLINEVEADFAAQKAARKSYDQIVTSPAMKVLTRTARMVSEVCSNKTRDEKVAAINVYKNHFNSSIFANFMKVIATVVSAALGFAVGVIAAIAATTGLSVLLGPGAVVPGVITGITVGGKVAIAVGGLLAGTAVGTAAGIGFFSRTKAAKMINPVADQALDYLPRPAS